MELDKCREILKELGWVRDEVFEFEGELYCYSFVYIVGEFDSDPIDTVEIRDGMIYYSGPNWISTNSFNPSNDEEKFLKWMNYCRSGEIDLDW